MSSESTPNATPNSLQNATANQRAVFEKLKNALPGIEHVQDMEGETAFTVAIDSSGQINTLRDSARALRGLSFQEKAKALTDLTLGAVGTNAVALAGTDPESRDLVHSPHPLSDAVKSGKGCCRYQAMLFFILARDARLGVSHSVLTQRMGQSFFSVYNLVFDDAHKAHALSLYNESLPDPENRKKFGYPNPSGNPMLRYDFSHRQDYYAYVSGDALAEDESPVLIKAKGNSREMEKWNTDLSQI